MDCIFPYGNSHNDRLAYDGALSVLLSVALSARAWQHAEMSVSSILCQQLSLSPPQRCWTLCWQTPARICHAVLRSVHGKELALRHATIPHCCQ